MYRLIYASTARSDLDEAGLRQIVETARRNNAANGISGMLLYMDGNFIQLLEGDKPVVEATFSRIEADERHRGVIVLDGRDAGARVFENWSMGYHRPPAGDREAASVFALSAQAVEDRMPAGAPREIVRFMRNFTLINRG